MPFCRTVVVIILVLHSFVFGLQIKSLQVYASDNQTTLPIVIAGDKGTTKLTVEFDIQSDVFPQLAIVFLYCSRNWQAVNSVNIQNGGFNIFDRIEYESLPSFVRGADYHVKLTFPDSKGIIRFPYSGNWILRITDISDTSLVYAERRFYVVENNVPLTAKFYKDYRSGNQYYPADLGRFMKIMTTFELPGNLFPQNLSGIEIIINQKLYQTIKIDNSSKAGSNGYMEWNGDRKFVFWATELRPGNEYRQTDTRNANLYPHGDVYAQREKIEYSGMYVTRKEDLNGAKMITPYKEPFAEYLNVTFTLALPEKPNGDVYLTGSFNQWQILPEYKMKKDEKTYSLTIPLKRGVYDYQYCIVNPLTGVEDWHTYEGNNYNTTLNISVFVYYNDPSIYGVTRIIGYRTFINKYEKI